MHDLFYHSMFIHSQLAYVGRYIGSTLHGYAFVIPDVSSMMYMVLDDLWCHENRIFYPNLG